LVSLLPVSNLLILNGGKLLGAVFSTTWNFVTYRHWVFVNRSEGTAFSDHFTPGMVSIVIPAYNEMNRLPERLRKLAQVLPNLFPVEILVVDDGSTDDTAKVVYDLASQDPTIRCISYQTNKGKGKAVQTGMQAAVGEYLVFTDADETFTSDHIKAVIDQLADGTTIVVGSRRTGLSQAEDGVSAARRILSRGFNLIIQGLLLPGIHDTQCGLKGFHRNAGVEIFSRQKLNRFAFDVELLALAKALGLQVLELPVSCSHCSDSKVNAWVSPLQMGWDVLRLKMAFLTNSYRLPRQSVSNREGLLAAAIFALAMMVRIPWLWLVPRYIDELKEVNLAYQISLGLTWPLHNAAYDIGAMHNYILGGIFKLLGPSIYWPRLYVSVLSAATVVLIYWLGRESFNRWVGLVAAGLLLTNGMHILITHMAWSNSTTPFFFLLALGLTMIAEQKKSGRWLVGAFFAWALALQTHSSVIIYVIVAVIYVTRSGFRRETGITIKWYYTAALAFMIGYFNMIYYNLVSLGGSIKWLAHKSYALETHPGFSSYISNLENMLVELFRTLSSTYSTYQHPEHYLTQPLFVLTIGLLIMGSYYAVKRKRILPLWMIIGSLAIIPIINQRYVFYLSTRYIMPAVLCALLLISLGLVQGIESLSKGFSFKRAVYAPARIILIGLIIGQVIPFYAYCDRLEKTNQSNYMALAVLANIENKPNSHKKVVLLDQNLPIENGPLPYLLSLSKHKYIFVSPDISTLPYGLRTKTKTNYIAVLSSRGYRATRLIGKAGSVTSISCQVVMPIKKGDRTIYLVDKVK
ncbi:MAG: glycosyltransferase, partial [Ignavibacteriales bacterium]